jgi:hypothetical protein
MRLGRKKPVGVVLSAGLVAALGAALAAGTAPREDRTIYVTVLGGPGGGPMLDVTAGQFQVREDNVVRELTGIRAANEPVSTVLLLGTTRQATNAIQDIRKAVVDYATTHFSMNPQARLAIGEFAGQAVIKVPFTSSLDEIKKAVTRVIANTDGGSVMNEGLVAASQELAKENTPRKAIVTINMEPTDEFSQLNFELVADEVRKSGATVYSIQIASGTRRDAGREALLTALTTNSGGLRLTTMTPSALTNLLGSIASLSGVQYALTFSRPDGAPPATQTNVLVNREGARPLTNQWSGK